MESVIKGSLINHRKWHIVAFMVLRGVFIASVEGPFRRMMCQMIALLPRRGLLASAKRGGRLNIEKYLRHTKMWQLGIVRLGPNPTYH